MAKAPAKKEEKAAEAEEAAPPKKKGKLPLIIALVVVLAGAGGGAWFFLSKKGDAADAPQAAKAQPPKPPVFVPLEPFTVNLVGEPQEQYLQMASTLKVLDASAGDSVKQYMPEIRHRILALLSTKRPTEISTSSGRELLAEELRQVTNNILLVAAGKPPKPVNPVAAAAPAPAPAAAEEPKAAEGEPDKPEGPAAAPPAPPAAPVATPAPAVPARAAADDPVQSVFFTSFIIQ